MCIRDSLPKEPLINDPPPAFPFAETSSDLFSVGQNHYLVYADRLTGWVEVASWQAEPTSSQVIAALRRMFVALGVPVVLRTDNGPQYASSEFKEFLKDWEVTPRLSAPCYPQSNGHAEAAVKVVKKLVLTTSADVKSEPFLRLSLIHI